MVDVRLSEDLWTSRMLPEGLLERWFVNDGAMVEEGTLIAEVRIEDALHDVVAPAAGRLSIKAQAKSMIEPGAVLGQLSP